GIVYVDIWDGFVDEGGRFSPQGPDYEGQIRRLRTNDGLYFTKFGARKLAHYVEREIQRSITNRGLPVALPVPDESGPPAPGAKPTAPKPTPPAGTPPAAAGATTEPPKPPAPVQRRARSDQRSPMQLFQGLFR